MRMQLLELIAKCSDLDEDDRIRIEEKLRSIPNLPLNTIDVLIDRLGGIEVP